MAKCPECGSNIDHLHVVVDERNIYVYKDENIDFSQRIEEILDICVRFRCPECDEVVTEDREMANEILGDSENQDDIDAEGTQV